MSLPSKSLREVTEHASVCSSLSHSSIASVLLCSTLEDFINSCITLILYNDMMLSTLSISSQAVRSPKSLLVANGRLTPNNPQQSLRRMELTLILYNDMILSTLSISSQAVRCPKKSLSSQWETHSQQSSTIPEAYGALEQPPHPLFDT